MLRKKTIKPCGMNGDSVVEVSIVNLREYNWLCILIGMNLLIITMFCLMYVIDNCVTKH